MAVPGYSGSDSVPPLQSGLSGGRQTPRPAKNGLAAERRRFVPCYADEKPSLAQRSFQGIKG